MPRSTIANYAWTYNEANRISHFTNASHTAENLLYEYDAAGQLTDATTSTVGWDYEYDENGNRESTTTAVVLAGSSTKTYGTGDDNRMSTDGTFAYSYDAEGNLIQKTKLVTGNPTGETTIYMWDHRNRLQKVTQYDSYDDFVEEEESSRVEYKYDVFNNMVGRRVFYSGSGTATTSEHFIYDQGQVVLKLADNTDVVNRYLWAPAVDMLLAQEDASNDVAWALGDNLNTVRDWVNDSGTVVAHKAYDAYGVAVLAWTTGSLDTDFGWTGRFHDDVTGLQYNQMGGSRGRWYDPAIGRWINQDAIGLRAGPNPYEYVGNGPINGVDPSGLIPDGPGPWDWKDFDPYGHTWDTLDFIRHYFFGFGSPVDLARVGLLGVLQAAIKRELDSFKQGLPDLLRSHGLNCEHPSLHLTTQVSFPVLAGAAGWADPMTVINNATVVADIDAVGVLGCVCQNGVRHAVWYRGDATITFRLIDRFANPLDIGGPFAKGFDFGFPYDITASWSDSVSWNINYD